MTATSRGFLIVIVAAWCLAALTQASASDTALGTWGTIAKADQGLTRRALSEFFGAPGDVQQQPPGQSHRALLASAKQEAGLRDSTGPFVIPLLPYGLSNQILALKETLALAHVLNWTVVTYGFWPHRSELPPEAQWIESESLVVRRRLAAADAQGLEPTAPSAKSAGKATRADWTYGSARSLFRTSQVSGAPLVRSLQGQQPWETLTIPFDTIFDRSALAPVVRLITYEEAVQQYGWSQGGPLDAVVALRPVGLNITLGKILAAGLLSMRGLKVRMLKGFERSCDQKHLAGLSAAVAGRRWVAFYGYREIVQASRFSYGDLPANPDPCARAFQLVSRHLIKSALIADTARNFVDVIFSEAAAMQPKQPPVRAGASLLGPYFMAVHVRPYPDTCLSYYTHMTEFNLAAATKVCSNPRNLIHIVGWVRRLVAAQVALAASSGACLAEGGGLQPGGTANHPASGDVAIFVMAHPHVRDAVRRELRRLWAAADGLRKTVSPSAARDSSTTLPPMYFLDVSDLPSELRHHIASNSLLSMVEQQICRTASAFIGSKASSISIVVAQERAAATDPATVVAAAAALARLEDEGNSHAQHRKKHRKDEGEGQGALAGGVPCDLAAALDAATVLV